MPETESETEPQPEEEPDGLADGVAVGDCARCVVSVCRRSLQFA